MKRTRVLILVAVLFLLSSPVWADTYTVTNCADSGPGSLRYELASAEAGDEVVFDITTLEAGYSTGEAGPGLVTNEAGGDTWFRIIIDTSSLTVTPNNISIKGSTQTHEANNTGPKVEIRSKMSLAAFYVQGNYTTIEGLVINQIGSSSGNGIHLTAVNNCHIYGCYIGTTASGEAALSTKLLNGININNGSYNNIIGGTSEPERNIISGNSFNGITMTNTSSNEVLGNYIGLDANGSDALTNVSSGIYLGLSCERNRIGNGSPSGRNVISGNGNGVVITGSGANNNQVLGNFIGVQADGTSPQSNTAGGILISDTAQDNRIGSSESSAQRNIISGHSGSNDYGIKLDGVTNNYIEGNWIGLGTDESSVPNYYGIELSGSAQSNFIYTNVVSGNNNDGIYIHGNGTNSNEVLGNHIGTDSTGMLGRGNVSDGVFIGSSAKYNIIGSSGESNIISGNSGCGIRIESNNNKVFGNYIGLKANGTDNLQNSSGGISILNATGNEIGDGSPGRRNIISGNNANGVFIAGLSAQQNGVLGNYIGTQKDGITPLPNNQGGINIFNNAHHNYIGSTESTKGNVISGHSGSGDYGIKLDGVTNNYIEGNWIGLGTDESAATNETGVIITNSQSNYIISNIISGNKSTGIHIYGSGTNSNEVTGNYIGTTTEGTAPLKNGEGILIEYGAQYNRIGNGTELGRNIISGNEYGITISESGTNYNEILGNYIGTTSNGASALPNAQSGITIDLGAKYNKIGNGTAGGRNVISGNTQKGIYITSTNTASNEVLGNYIGVQADGTSVLSNESGGILIEGEARFNRIGSSEPLSMRNIIAGHSFTNEFGIGINGASNNIIEGNWIGIGTDESIIPNHFGIALQNSSQSNHIISNVISGNAVAGIYIEGSGSNSNEVLGNYIGTNSTGTTDKANSLNGIQINNASYNKIGNGTVPGRNIISGNGNRGIYMLGSGTNSNEVLGNYIGTTSSGEAALSNQEYGIVLSNGACFNHIGGNTPAPGTNAGNIISGNTSRGIYIHWTDTTNNQILGNCIGTNANGSLAIPNGQGDTYDAGIYITYSSNNYIGNGTAAGRNIVSGNNLYGIILQFAGADNNEVKYNYFGTNLDGTSNLGNISHGVFILNDASFNRIGPFNLIAFNGLDGIRLDGTDTTQEVITLNSIFSNGSKGITIVNGANPTTSTPEVLSAGYNEFTGITRITGEGAPASGTVEVYQAEGGQGKTYRGLTIADSAGNWALNVTSLISGDAVVATGTTANPETSEFSQPFTVTTSVAKQYQPDNMIATLESGADYIGQGIYTTDGTGETRTLSITTGESAAYYIKIENDGNSTDEVIVTGPASSGDWTITYYDAKTGGNNITSQLTGAGWVTTLGSTESAEIRFTAQNSGTDLSTLEVLVTSTSSYEGSAVDAVKASTTASPIPPPPSDLASFSLRAPTTAIAGTAFSLTVTAKDSTGATEETIVGTTTLSVDDGLITPESIDASSFTSGIWTGNVILSKPGGRTVTAANGSAAGTTEIVVYNATMEITSNGVTITIPAGATSQEVSVTVTEVTDTPGDPPVGYYIGGKIFDIVSTPSQFSLPVTVTIPINSPLADARVYYWNGSAWSRDGITIISITATSLTFTTTHFTVFAPMAALSNNLVRFGPNPYNPNSGTIAKIWYWLESDYETSIYVVDITGTLVWKQTFPYATNGSRAGANSIDFNGKDRWGKVLGDGVYLYKIVQNGRSIGGGKIAIIK